MCWLVGGFPKLGVFLLHSDGDGRKASEEREAKELGCFYVQTDMEGARSGLSLVIFLSGPIGPNPPNFSGPDKETAGPVYYTVLCSQIVVFYSGYYVKKTQANHSPCISHSDLTISTIKQLWLSWASWRVRARK